LLDHFDFASMLGLTENTFGIYFSSDALLACFLSFLVNDAARTRNRPWALKRLQERARKKTDTRKQNVEHEYR
jgi:hypothetical protein